MRVALGILAAVGISLSAQTDEAPPQISLSVPSGAPLRLYLTKRLPKRLGAPVEAKLLESVFSFDREVLPIGTVALGQVNRVQPVGKWQRARAIVNGDFTPLHLAEVEFTTLILPDGRKLATHTVETVGLSSIYTEPSKKPSKKKSQTTQPQNQNGGILGTAKQTAKDRINGAINAYLRRGTRFDASLRDPLPFGFLPVKQGDFAALGSQPLPDSVVHARLLTGLDSASAKLGQEVKAVVTAPLFSPDHKLVFPEGTLLTGTVVLAKRARMFHRPGQLRFNFQRIDLPEEVAHLRSTSPAPMNTPLTTPAILEAAEGSGTAPIKVDSEGGVQAKESKTRFIAPVISLMLASRAADNDAGHHNAAGATGGDANVGGRTLGGGSGFGMLGAAAAQSSRYVGMAFGYYGLAWSVYSSVVARGGEVQFDKNAVMDIKFGTRKLPPGSKFQAADTGAAQ